MPILERSIVRLFLSIALSLILIGCSNGGRDDDNGRNVLPEAPTVSLGYSTKTLQFRWNDVPNATYYQLSENLDGNSGYTVVADNLTATSVSHEIALYNRINARYIISACNNDRCTDSTEIFMANQLVDAIGYFKAANSDAGDNFGFSVSISADGTTIAVSAPCESSSTTGVDGDHTDNSNFCSGAVYVFARNGSSWSQQAYLKAMYTGINEMFGNSVSLSSDGSTLAVGAWYEDSSATGVNGDQSDNNTMNSGAVYIFSRDGTSWSQQAYLKASNTEYDDWFGKTVSLSADGTTLAVAALHEDSSSTGINGDQNDNNAMDSGAVYIFTRSASSWSQQAYLKASNTARGGFFGKSISLASDGNTLAVGASGESWFATSSGAVYVFSRSGTTWSQQDYLKASNKAAYDYFGFSVSLSGDGATMAVGAYSEDSSATGVDGNQLDNNATNSGSVYVFTRNNTTWNQQAYIKASNTESEDWFGYVLSLSNDGNTMAVGTYYEDSSAIGINGNQADNGSESGNAVYVFIRNGTTWKQRAYVKASNTEAFDFFGRSISLTADGNTLAAGATNEDSGATSIGGDQYDNSARASGAVYLY